MKELGIRVFEDPHPENIHKPAKNLVCLKSTIYGNHEVYVSNGEKFVKDENVNVVPKVYKVTEKSHDKDYYATISSPGLKTHVIENIEGPTVDYVSYFFTSITPQDSASEKYPLIKNTITNLRVSVSNEKRYNYCICNDENILITASGKGKFKLTIFDGAVSENTIKKYFGASDDEIGNIGNFAKRIPRSTFSKLGESSPFKFYAIPAIRNTGAVWIPICIDETYNFWGVLVKQTGLYNLNTYTNGFSLNYVGLEDRGKEFINAISGGVDGKLTEYAVPLVYDKENNKLIPKTDTKTKTALKAAVKSPKIEIIEDNNSNEEVIEELGD